MFMKEYVLRLKEVNVLKKHISLILVLTLLLSLVFSFGSVAFASSFTATPESSSIPSAGSVDFTFVVTNDGTETLNGTIMLGSTTIGTVSAAIGMPAEYTYPVNITDSMLGQTLTFTLNGMQATAKVDKKVLTPKIAGTAYTPYALYGEGDTVKFEFRLENQGDAPLENITVSAPELNGGKAIGSPISLAPGENKVVKFSYTMAKDITINPVVNYSAGGAAQPAYKMSPVTLTLTKRDVKPVLAASNLKPAPGEEVEFTLTLTNGGNVPYKDIKVLVNGESKDYPSTLDANGTQTGKFKMSFQTSTEVSCSISLKDHTGAIRNVNSNSLTIDLPVDSTTVDSRLNFTMSVDRPQLTAAGTINFSGMITNGTDYELTNVKVTEATLGEVYAADTLAAGSTATVPFTVDINATTTYNFVLTATDKDGNAYTKNAEPVTVTIQSAAASATPGFDDAADVTETLAPDGNLGAGSIGTLGIIAIVLVVLIIGVGVTLVVLWKKGQGPKSPSTPGRAPSSPARKRPASSSARRRPAPKSYRDRNNF